MMKPVDYRIIIYILHIRLKPNEKVKKLGGWEAGRRWKR
jgi:hypothetical protein